MRAPGSDAQAGGGVQGPTGAAEDKHADAASRDGCEYRLPHEGYPRGTTPPPGGSNDF